MKNLLSLVVLLLFSQMSTAQEYSYIWANQYPAIADPAINCCYDFDGDMVPDDQVGAIMASLASLLGEDFQLLPNQAIIDNQWVRVIRWGELPSGDGPVTADLITGLVDNSGLDLQGRIDGNIIMTIDPAALSTFSGTKTNGLVELYAAESEHLFLTPLVSAAGSTIELILIPLNEVRISGTIIQNTVACEGVCSENLAGKDPVLLGGVGISGLMHHADEIDAINLAAASCLCAGVIPSTPLMDYMEDDKALTISCNYQDLDSSLCGVGDPAYCQTVENQCAFAGVQAGLYDQDSNQNGVADSKSVGGLIGFSPASISGAVDLIFENDFE